jgi:DNA adenine methylase
MMNIPHPIPYQGSKRNLADPILSYFPGHTTRLIEPFAGSAALSLAAASQGRFEHFVLNDLNAPLIRLWDAIIHQPDDIANQYESLWQTQIGQERQFYDQVRDLFNQTQRPDYFLYLLARCVKAAVRYNTNGAFNQSPDNRRKGRKPAAMRHDIREVSCLLKGKTTLTSGDYQETLDAVTSHDLVYMDPPYQGVNANRDPRYIKGIQFDDFVQALKDLNRRDVSFIVSYDGRTGNKTFGKPLPELLDLQRIELSAGRSSQATLLGREVQTYESLYLSPALVTRLGSPEQHPMQLSLFGEPA